MSTRPRLLRTAGVFVLILVGLVGVLLPVLPGLPLLILGIAILGLDHPVVRPVRRLIAWLSRLRRA